MQSEVWLLREEQRTRRQIRLDAGRGIKRGDVARAGLSPDGNATLDLPGQFWVALVDQVHVAAELGADVPGFAVGAALGLEVSQDEAPVVLVLEQGIKAACNRVALVQQACFDSNGLPGLPHGVADQWRDPIAVIAGVPGFAVEQELLKAGVNGVAPGLPFRTGTHDPCHLSWGLVVHHRGDRVSYPASPVVIAMNLGVKSQARYGLERDHGD